MKGLNHRRGSRPVRDTNHEGERMDEFDRIIAGLDSPIVLNAIGEECLPCDKCGRLVRARVGAQRLHSEITCEMYREPLSEAPVRRGKR